MRLLILFSFRIIWQRKGSNITYFCAVPAQSGRGIKHLIKNLILFIEANIDHVYVKIMVL
jgi:hypothetical protein